MKDAMELKLVYKTGQSQLDQEELAGLKITSCSNADDIEIQESKSILKAIAWTEKNMFSPDKIFTEVFIKEIHKRMFGDVWTWAGKYRLSNKSLGVDKSLISSEVKQVISNTRFWIESESYDTDEIAIRFMHRLMQVQCFSGGNARHAKLMADVVIEHVLNGDVFTWGASLNNSELAREKFLDALKKADKGKMDDLIKFSRS